MRQFLLTRPVSKEFLAGSLDCNIGSRTKSEGEGVLQPKICLGMAKTYLLMLKSVSQLCIEGEGKG